MQNIEFSLIIPCYNEGKIFEDSVSKIVTVLRGLRSKWEIILVEDKSTDQTAQSVKNLLKKFNNSKAIFHRENMGRGASVSDGIKLAKGDICGYLDVDLEVSEKYIPIFIDEVKKGSDLVVGRRFYDTKSSSLSRVIASKLYSFTVRQIINLPISDSEAGYKFFNKKNILPVLQKTKDKKWFWDTEICARAHAEGLKVTEIPVLFAKRPEKKSTVKLIPDSIEYLIKLIKFKLNDSK